MKAGFSKPDSILAGDRNLMANSLPNPSILHITTDNPLRWTWELHQSKGNVLFAGGQVEEWNNAALAGAGSQQAGADLFMPTVLPAPNGSTSFPAITGIIPAPIPALASAATTTGKNHFLPLQSAPAPSSPPANSSSGNRGGFSPNPASQTGMQNQPGAARNKFTRPASTNVSDGGTVTPE